MNLIIDLLKRIFLVVISFVIFSGYNSFAQDVGPVQWFVVDIQGKKITDDFNVTGTIQWHYLHDIQNEGINIYYAEGISDNPSDFKFLEKVRIEDAQTLSKHEYGYSFSGISGTQKTWTFAVTAFTPDGVSEFSKFYTASFKYNEPPYLVEFITYPTKKAKVGEEYSYKPEIETNIDKPTLEYILEDAPPNTKYNPETGEISWIPLNDEFKYFHIMLKVILDDEVVSIVQQSWGVTFSDCDKPNTSSIIIHAKDESGNPVSTVTATIFDYEEGVNPTTKPPKMIIGNSGASYVIAKGLDKGKYYILVDAFSKDKTIAFKSNWYNDAERLEDAVPFEIGCNEQVELNFVMKQTTPPIGYLVSGKVLDKNTLEPAKVGVLFYGHSENTNELKVFNFPMNEDGTYIGKLPDTYKYTAVVRGYLYSKLHNNAKYYTQYYDMADKPEDAKLIELNSDVTGIDFYLTPVPVFNNSLYGTVVDIYDNPQIRVEVTAHKIITDSSGTEYKYVENNSFVDATGSFKFENLEPGEYILFARPSKFYNPSVYYVDNDSSAYTWRNATRIKVEDNGDFGSYKIVLVPMDHILGKGKIKGIVRSDDDKGIIKSGDEVQSSDKAISGA
ncbi:MAG: carboxypeptidase-like regulatory domain-containing protein, partial [Candidatus Kapaibacterium sp.]